MSIFDQLMQAEYDAWGYELPQHEWCTPEQTRVEVEFVKHVAGLTPTDTILDVQCSWGRHAVLLGTEGYQVIGVDISSSLIERATELARQADSSAQFICDDLRTIHYPAHFDVVYQIQSSCFEAWRSPTDVQALLCAVWNVLKPNGCYVFGWKDDWNTAKGAASRWRRVLAQHDITTFEGTDLPFYTYDAEQQTAMAREAGFDITAMYHQYHRDASYEPTAPGLILVVKKTRKDV